MRTWKTIVCLLGLSTCAALLGAACTAEGTDPVEPAEEAVAPEPAPILPRGGRERCEIECRDRFERCVHEIGELRERDARCVRERDLCSERCRRF